MAPPTENFGDSQRELHASPVRLGLHDIWQKMHEFNDESLKRHAKLEEKMDRFVDFANGNSAKGDDGAVSRLNAHSADLGEIKDKVKWVERGLLVGLLSLVMLVAIWGISRIADGTSARADQQNTGGH